MNMAIWVACLGGIVTWLALFPLRAFLVRRRVLDIPNERSSHRQPTPRGGGLIIVAVVLAGWLLLGFSIPTMSSAMLAAFTLAAGMIAGVSWMDDIRSLPARIRFGVQSLAALLAIGTFGFWDSVTVPLLGELRFGWFGLPITFLWIVGLTNAYNFMDGIDGIAGSQAVVAGIGWALMGWLGGLPFLCALGLLVAASNLGFLLHNWPPARIFMGDVGSAFLGFTLALLPLVVKSQSVDPILSHQAFFIGILMVWPFVADTAFTLVVRLRRGHNIFAAHRMHLYQRLIAEGVSHRSVTLLYAALAVTGVLFALGWSLNVPTTGACLPAILGVGVLGWIGVRVHECRRAQTQGQDMIRMQPASADQVEPQKRHRAA